MSEFNRLALEWKRKGSPPCDHPRRDKEYHLGADTGDRGCLVWGETWWHNDEPPPAAPAK